MVQRAAIYCRVSTADQSSERQERELRAFAERAGYETVPVFRETGSGAKVNLKSIWLETTQGSHNALNEPLSEAD